MTKNQILAQAKRLRICCEISSPGDGVSRYNFHTPGPKPHTYGRTIGHCLGKREAEVYLRGYEEATQLLAGAIRNIAANWETGDLAEAVRTATDLA